MGASGSVIKQQHLDPRQPHNQPQGDKDEDIKLFLVSLSEQCRGYSRLNLLPPQFYLKLSNESLDFIDVDTKLAILNFPYQHILCWGSSSETFKFTVEGQEEIEEEEHHPEEKGKEQEGGGDGLAETETELESREVLPSPKKKRLNIYTYKIVVKTHQGSTIERVVMKTVRALMAVMEKSIVVPTEFAKLKDLLIVDKKLEQDWMNTLKVSQNTLQI